MAGGVLLDVMEETTLRLRSAIDKGSRGGQPRDIDGLGLFAGRAGYNDALQVAITGEAVVAASQTRGLLLVALQMSRLAGNATRTNLGRRGSRAFGFGRVGGGSVGGLAGEHDDLTTTRGRRRLTSNW